MAASHDEELAILDARFGSGSPASWFVGMSTSAAEPADDGTGFTEPSGNGYARVEVVNDVANWPAAALVDDGGGGDVGQKTHANAITFPTATGAQGTMEWAGLFTAATGGTFRWKVQLDEAKDIADGDTGSWAPGALKFRVD